MNMTRLIKNIHTTVHYTIVLGYSDRHAYLIRAEMLSMMTFKRHGPTTQDNQGESNVSFSVQTPGVLG